MKKNIAIVMGGYSSEFDISIQSGNVVYKHLDRELYNPYRIHITKEKWAYVSDDNQQYDIDKNDFSLTINNVKTHFDAAFNIVHGTPGEDGLLQAYFELIEIPQTACDFYQAALTFNKRDCISTLKPYGIPTATNYFLNKGDTINTEEIIKTVGLPCFVKANKAGSSYGVSKVNTENDLIPAIDVAYKEDDEIIIESFLSGTEVSVGVITYKGKDTVLPITEIVSENEFFDYEAKYLGKSEEITPARLSDSDTKKVKDLALKVYQILKMKGFSRSEYIFHNGEPYFIEMNTNPGFSEASILPQQALAAGISIKDLLTNTIEEAINNQKK
ncbi:D-alanine--D-alanine ligase [Aquimarina sp. AD10]|uniref:D-alanine--D-alanine ligase n=1 Tax=Aquimarina TaxID=290174 RepID=UPI000E4C1038|nr:MULTISPECIES: D-alanine--D-alanine ligase [Aquimarina]AXT63169.1 D-alanine--D-alanine ligase [Aquimarina sp. AD10]RKM98616.1 D-alanine--D-alanine ligase [Aquimarina sp. AD10]